MANRDNKSSSSSNSNGQNMTIEQALETAHRHWNAGQNNQAEILCQKVLAVWPGNPVALHLLGLMAHSWGNLDLAIDYIRKACLSPQVPAVYLSNLAEMCRQKGLLEEGENAARRAISIDPKGVGAWNNLGIILQEAGKYEESLACLERVVAAKPDQPQGFNNMGNTYKKMGQSDKARDCYQRAIDLDANYPEAYSNLSNLYKDLGEIDAAIDVARQAIEANPRFADAYINAAAAEAVRGQYDRSVSWINSMLAFAPTHASALAAKAEYLNKLDAHHEALSVAKQAISAAPDNGNANNSLGRILQSMGKYEEALAAFEKASASKSITSLDLPYINKGVVLMEINRPQEALAAFEKALEINPRSATAYFNKADIKTFSKDDPEIEVMERLLSSYDQSNPIERMVLHFALGKAFMDADDPQKAFSHLDAGNKIKRSSIDYNRAETERMAAKTANVFTREFIDKISNKEANDDLPIFIIGMPRSGTTLLEQILAAHPDVHGAGELVALRQSIGQARSEDGKALSYPDGFASISKASICQIAERYLHHAKRLAGEKRRVVDKMPVNFIYAGIIAAAMPHARIIHCRRDPMDTCLSCYTKLFTERQDFAYDLAELGGFYKAYSKLMNHWREVLPPDRFIEIDYEAVVSDLENEARKMIDFCGLEWNESCTSFYNNNRPVRSASMNQVRKPIYKQSVGRWKKYEAFLSPLIEELGADIKTV